MASASVAKADAYMELISGNNVVQLQPGTVINGLPFPLGPGPQSGPFAGDSGSYSITVAYADGGSGNAALFDGSVGSWTVNVSSGSSAGNVNITLTDQSSGNTVNAGLQIIYSSSPYILSGKYLDGAAETGLNGVAADVQGYTSAGLYTGGGLGTLTPLATPTTAPGLVTSSAIGFVLPKLTPGTNESTKPITINGTYAVTESISFLAPTSPGAVSVSASGSFNNYVPPAVPDGSTTASLLGCTLLGLTGLRSKFGAKRA